MKVKLVLVPVVLAIGLLMSIPLVFANGANATAPYACGQLGVILDTIRSLESSGDYTVRADGGGTKPSRGSAAGAYQYITSTWRYWAGQADVDTDTYPTADTAPPDIQDRVAGVNVQHILDTHDGLVEAVPVIWYYPVAWGNDAIMDAIPAASFGNTLTVRDYQTRWLNRYNKKLLAAGDDLGGCSGVLDATGQWALPAPRESMTPAGITAPHHTYPAWDHIIDTGTPIYAVTAGAVVNTTHFAGNWDRDGCGTSSPPARCGTCGIGLTIQSPNGLRHTYCHALLLHVAEGDTVAPGQLVATSGDTGRSGTPHLHLEFRINNVRYCPQQLVLALYNGTPVPDPATLPQSGCH